MGVEQIIKFIVVAFLIISIVLGFRLWMNLFKFMFSLSRVEFENNIRNNLLGFLTPILMILSNKSKFDDQQLRLLGKCKRDILLLLVAVSCFFFGLLVLKM